MSSTKVIGRNLVKTLGWLSLIAFIVLVVFVVMMKLFIFGKSGGGAF